MEDYLLLGSTSSDIREHDLWLLQLLAKDSDDNNINFC